MRHTQEVQELWENLDTIGNQIQDLKRQREQIDEWLREAFQEQTETIRALSLHGVEPEYA